MGSLRVVPGDKGQLVVVTLLGLVVVGYGIVTGSIAAILIGIAMLLVGGLVLRLLG